MFNEMNAIELGESSGFKVHWNIQKAPNGHIALIGASGSGKSVLAQYMILQIVKQGGTVLIIDHQGTLSDDQIYASFRDEFNQYRNDTYAYKAGIPCKLFQPIRYSDGMIESEEVTAGALTEVIGRTFKLRTEQKSLLRVAIRQVIDDGTYHECGLKALQEALCNFGTKKATEIAERLYSLFEHNSFIDGDEMIIQKKINIVHLSRLSLLSQEAITEMIISYIWRLGNADVFKNQNFFFFLDECQNIDGNSKSALAHMISEGRRLGINLLLATQMILQGSTNAVQQRISQCALILFFRPAMNRISLTAKMINPNNKEKWLPFLGQLKVGNFIATGNLLIGNKEVDYPLMINLDITSKDKLHKVDLDTKNMSVNGASNRQRTI